MTKGRDTVDQIDVLKARLDGDGYSNEYLLAVLDSARCIIMERRYPFQVWPSELEPQFLDTQIRVALELIGRTGAEGQVAHSENGIGRSFSGADVSPEVLSGVVPKAGVL